jgi:hypothetical protein
MLGVGSMDQGALQKHLAQTEAETRELIRQTLQLLRDPPPDTFLGRKTQKPFSFEKKDEH